MRLLVPGGGMLLPASDGRTHRRHAACPACASAVLYEHFNRWACLQIAAMPGLDKQMVQEVMYDIQQAERRAAEPSAQDPYPKAGTAQVTQACSWGLVLSLAAASAYI